MLWSLGLCGVGSSMNHTHLPVTGCGVFLLACVVNIDWSVLCCFLKLLETQNGFLFWSVFFGANLCWQAWGKIKMSCAVTGNKANEDFLLSIPVVPAIEFLSLSYQELWKKDPEDRVGTLQSSKLVLLTSWDSFNLGRKKVSFDMNGVQNQPNKKWNPQQSLQIKENTNSYVQRSEQEAGLGWGSANSFWKQKGWALSKYF